MIIDDNIVKRHGLVVAAVYAVVKTNPMVTQSKIAAYCHISVSSVKRALDELQRFNYIKVQNNKPYPNTYVTLQTNNNYGLFGLVQLHEDEHYQLMQDYPAQVVDYYIQQLDCYLKNNPDKIYQSHYATLVSWILKHKMKQELSKQKSIDEDQLKRVNQYLDLVNQFEEEEE